MATLADLNQDCPEHDKISCDDGHLINAGINFKDGFLWCRRCEGLSRIRERSARTGLLKQALEALESLDVEVDHAAWYEERYGPQKGFPARDRVTRHHLTKVALRAAIAEQENKNGRR